jgi:hypothetical protein
MDPNVEFRSATEIVPGLWLGNQASSRDVEFLKNIDVVINCSKHIPFEPTSNTFKIRLSVNDPGPPPSHRTYDGDLSKYDSKDDQVVMIKSLDALTGYIAKMRKNNARILIHCHAGAQRSAAVMAAYLIKHINWKVPSNTLIDPLQLRRAKFKKVVEFIVKKRPVAFGGGRAMSFRPALIRYFDL